MKTAHTPGPWIVIADEGKGDHPNHQFRFVGTADYDEGACRGHIVAKLTDAVEIEANANLLAAAPDLLAACDDALVVIHGEGLAYILKNTVENLRAAIAKAEGGAR